MKQRLFNNWTFTRALYLGMGIVLIIQTVPDRNWMGAVFGGYFAAMGLFAFGCASGNCSGGIQRNPAKGFKDADQAEVEFEEVK